MACPSPRYRSRNNRAHTTDTAQPTGAGSNVTDDNGLRVQAVRDAPAPQTGWAEARTVHTSTAGGRVTWMRRRAFANLIR